MSTIFLTWAWKQQAPSSTAKYVLIALADYANANGVCWPSQRTLAERCQLTERSIGTQLRSLEAAGLIARQPRMVNRGRTSDLYKLNPSARKGAEISNSENSSGTQDTIKDGLDSVSTSDIAPVAAPEAEPLNHTGISFHRNRKDVPKHSRTDFPNRPEQISDKPPLEPLKEASVVEPEILPSLPMLTLDRVVKSVEDVKYVRKGDGGRLVDDWRSLGISLVEIHNLAVHASIRNRDKGWLQSEIGNLVEGPADVPTDIDPALRGVFADCDPHQNQSDED